MKNNSLRTFSKHPGQAGGRDAFREHRLYTMIGCASIGLDEQGLSAAQLWHRLCRTHLVEERWRVAPRVALPLDARSDGHTDSGSNIAPPSLSRGYLPLMLRIDDASPRYRQHFFGVAA